MGGLVTGSPLFIPCTPQGIMELIARTGIDLKGKEAVVVGRSNIVGKPMALLLLAQHATVTICHSRTKDLPVVTRRADILIAAVGKAHMIKADMVKDGVIVIDVGVNRLENGKLTGDVDFDEVASKASYITPVPGGVGPMTIAMLMKNTLNAAMAVA
jgi:methylenetetrahydrofolate dehydrogenase (NADP+)/methenyltetrahydrofolate cyclohydrolase